MDAPVLVAYATKHGSTREVADVVAETLREHGLDAQTRAAATVSDLSGYGAVVLGGALYIGRWHPDAVHLLREHRRELAQLPVAVFAMGPRTLEQGDVEQSCRQLEHALAQVPEVRPTLVAVFGGVVDPKTLRFPFNRMSASDARDWHAIRRWAIGLAGVLTAAP